VAASLGLFSPALASAAGPPTILVEVRQCAGLDASRIRALYTLELGKAADGVGEQSLTVTCGPSETRLKVESALGSVERVIKTSLDREEPERVVALAAAQLVLAAWVEAPRERSAPESARDTLPAAREAPAPRAQASLTTLELQVDAGLHARPLGTLAIGPAFGLSGTAWLGSWGGVFGATTDRVTVGRALGVAELMVSELELSFAWRSNVEPGFSFELSLGPALASVHLRGIDPAASVRAGSVTAITVDAKGRAALRYRRGWLSLRAAVDGGYLVSGAEGTISADSTIVARGPWAGLTLGGGATW
jgi:hypothetical protein